jgi:molybdenum cofactor cytidylyltransferase
LIIASTAGSGFGGALALGSWDGGSVLEHVVAVVEAAGVEDITVVLGPRADDIIDSATLAGATIVIDYEWSEGLASGLRAGLDTMWRSAELETAVIVELDQPGIDAPTIASVLSAHQSGERSVTVPKYRYTRGGPVVVERVLWPRLMGLEGEVDLVGLIDAHKPWAAELWIDRLPPVRVETPADLERLVLGR